MSGDSDLTSELTKARRSSPPGAVDQLVHLLVVLASCCVWRGAWLLWDWRFGTGVVSAVGSILVGTTVLTCGRNVSFLRGLLPVVEGSTAADKVCRQIWQVLLVGFGVTMFWRGWWSIMDNLLPLVFTDASLDACASLLIGITLLVVVNFTILGSYGVIDDIALEGG